MPYQKWHIMLIRICKYSGDARKAPLRKESANPGSQELKCYIIGHEPFAQSISVIIEFNFLYGL